MKWLTMKSVERFAIARASFVLALAALVTSGLVTSSAVRAQSDSAQSDNRPSSSSGSANSSASSSTDTKDEPSRRASGAAVPTYGIAQVAKINEEIRSVWADNQIAPSPPATDGEWCRRVYLDILGRIPSVDELRAFVTSTRCRPARPSWSTSCSTDEAYTEEYARNWTTIWTNILIGRNGGTERQHADQPRGDAEVPPRFVRPQQAVRPDGLRAGHGHGQHDARRGRLQRRGELPGDEARRERGAGHGEDRQDLPGPAGAMHAVPQPSVQRLEAEEVLGVQRLLPPDAGRCGGQSRACDANAAIAKLVNQDFAGEGRQRRRKRSSSTSCATAC